MKLFKSTKGLLAACVVLTLVVSAAVYKYISWVDEELWKQNVTLINETTYQQAETVSTHFYSVQLFLKQQRQGLEKFNSDDKEFLDRQLFNGSNEGNYSFLVHQDDTVEDGGRGFDKTAVRSIKRKAEEGIVAPHICTRCGNKVINFYARVHFKDGKYAYLVTEVKLKSFLSGITDEFYNGQGVSYITDKNGFVLMRPATEKAGRTLKSFFDMLREGNNTKDKLDTLVDSIQVRDTGYAVLNIANELSLITYRPIKNSDWMLISVVPAAALAKESANILQGTFMLLAVVMLTLFIVFAFLFISENSKQKARMKELQMEQAAKAAKQADAAKTNFLFNMSHDIRTPMNALLGYTKLLQDELAKMNNPKLLGYLEKMDYAGKLLLSIINNVLDMARIESGKMEVDESYCRIDAVNKELCDVFAVEAKKKNVLLINELKVKHQHIMCDETKIKEVVANLLSNAFKYTPAGGKVTLRVEELSCSKPGYVRIKTEVTDNGIGMSEEYLPKLFDNFTRERNTTAGKIVGSGLGMAIVKRLVELLGGTIEVESKLGKGSRFTVILEHKLADEVYYKKVEAATDVAESVAKGKHILMAEDNDLNAEIAVYMLKKMGLTVERVADGVQCVKMMEQKPCGTYDLVLMDVQMPNMNGYQATQAIRNLPDKVKAAIPIVALTANAFAEDRQNALNAGMDAHIAKPIEPKEVERVLLELLK